MKKTLTASLAVAALLTLAGCSAAGSGTAPADAAKPSSSAPAPAPVLTGDWQQSNSKAADSYQTATITWDAIDVDWVTDGGATKSLYWAGSFTAPTAAGNYSWDSTNDTAKTSGAMLASSSATKTFTYADGVISYSVSLLGTTTTVKLKQKTRNAGTGNASPSAAGPTKAAGSLVSSGFGQKDEYAWVTALVHNDSNKVGQTVTVEFNAKDAAGTLVKSASQVESFSRVGQDLAVGTQIDVAKDVKIATVEATLLIEDKGAFSSKPFPEMKTTPVTVVSDGSTANFELSNPTDQPVQSPRLGIICYDAANAIIGGGSDFPQLVPTSGKVAVEASILTSGTPASCKVFTGAP